jgi:hypothetical protein
VLGGKDRLLTLPLASWGQTRCQQSCELDSGALFGHLDMDTGSWGSVSRQFLGRNRGETDSTRAELLTSQTDSGYAKRVESRERLVKNIFANRDAVDQLTPWNEHVHWLDIRSMGDEK